MNYSKFLEIISGVPRTIDLSQSTNVLTLGQGGLQFNDAGSGDFVMKAASSIASPYTIIWPDAQAASSGYTLSNDGTGVLTWVPLATGSVTAVSVSTANGFAGTSSGGATPALTLSTTITGVLKGNGTAISAATAGTDYVIPSGSITGTAGNVTATSNATLTTLSALTTASSLATVGTITSGTWNGSVIGISYGGTGQTSASAAFAALSPLTTAGDIIFENSTPAPARLPIGSTGQVLTVVAGLPAWSTPTVSPSSITLATNDILVGNGSNVAAAVAMSGDATIVASGALTLATVNSNTGPWGSSTSIPSFTVNGKGLITAASGNSVVAPAGTLTGSTLNSTVTASSLTSLGTQAQALNMGSYQINNLANGVLANDAVNYGQLTSISTGLIWQGSINDPDLVNDSLSTPPGSPVYSITYIISTSPTGAWAGCPGYATWWDGHNWIDLSTGNVLTSGEGSPVQIGDRFLVASSSPGGPANVGGSFSISNVGQLVTVTGNTPGSFTYSFQTPLNNWAVSDLEVGSQHNGDSFTYTTSGPYTFVVSSANATAGATYTNNGHTFTVDTTIVAGTLLLAQGTGVPTASGTLTKASGTGDSTITFSSYTGSNWIDFAGPGKVLAGSALAYTGNTLNVQVDSSTIGVNGSNQLYVENGGITNTQINASAAIAFSKLAALTSANILVGNGSNVATSVAMSGDVNINNTGSTSIVATSNGTLTTLSALTTASSLASVGTITSGTWHGSAIGISYGGTGQTTASAAFNALSPITTTGDLIVGTGTNTAGRLGVGSTGQVLTVSGGTAVWASPAASSGISTVEVSGQALSASTLYALRYELSSDSGTVGQMWKADNNTSSYDNFYVIGLAYPSGSVSIGGSVTVTESGLINVPSHGFTTGAPLYLGSSGACTSTAPTTAGLAVVRVGQVKDANNIWVNIQVMGVN